MKIASIVGARPQFIKCATLSRLIRNNKGISEIIIHTGQHYDKNMSDIFFSELDIPEPHFNLNVGSQSHAEQTALILRGIEKILMDNKPDWVIVYGDTNSTLAGALAAVKLNMNVAHVEAGLRSFNRQMPEEINRIATDHISSRLFAPTGTAMSLLAKEGLGHRAELTGDVMLDSILYSKELAEAKYRDKILLPYDDFYLATIHRQENTNDLIRLQKIFNAFSRLDLPVVIPLHPRTRDLLHKIKFNRNVKIIDPTGYLEMIKLLSLARKVMTDSGGIQKESYFLQKQCVTLRDETEWPETLQNNWNILTGIEEDNILKGVYLETTGPQEQFFGDGNASKKILTSLIN